MFSKKSIRFKLNMFVMAITFAIVCIGCVTAISIFFRIYEEDAAKNVSSAINSMETVVITSNEKKMSDFVDELAYISTEILDSKEMDSSQLFSKLLVHDSLMDLEFVQVISEGKIIAEDILCKPSVLTLALSDAPEAINTPVVWINGNPDTGIHIFAASPIRTSDGALTGLVVAGMLASSTEYTEYIRNTANMDATIFAGNLRFATSVKKHGKLQVGTELDPKIASIVLENGLEFQGKAQILEIPYITAYRPIKDHNGRTVGALFVGKSLSSLYIVRNRIISYIMLLGIVLLLLFYLISNRWLFRNVISPVLSVSAAVKTISEGNYSPVGGDHSKSGTEISSLYSSINSMAAEISSSKAKLESIAYYDSLTGLFNREFMYQKHKNVPLANNANSLSILFYIDVDNLKYINNLFGHRFGDSFLSLLGREFEKLRLENPSYEIYRIAGDEFVFCRTGPYSTKEVNDFARSIIAIFERPIHVEHQKISSSISIGISYSTYCEGMACEVCTGKCKKSLDLLLIEAEAAMYKVKSKGKNNYMLFDEYMNDEMQNKASILQDLTQAMANNELVLYYQPKFSLHEGRFNSFEALIRWRHPVKGFISPADFIPVAEESNLIIDIGAWVLKEACRFIKSFNEQNGTDFSVSVNISGHQLLSEGFEAYVDELLSTTGIKPENLEFEITESILLHSMNVVSKKLSGFQARNLKIALDDFGTGYSSLTYLKVLPINIIKIDKSFVDDITNNTQSFNILSNIVQIARHIGLKIVVEGIETYDQVKLIAQLDCDSIQGYYFSRPLPVEEIPAALEKLHKLP